MPLLQQVQLGRIDNSVSSSVLAFHRRSRTVLLLRSEYFVSKVASPDLFKWTDVGQWLCPVGLPPMLSCAALESYDALAVLFGSASETHLFLFNLSMQLINVVEMTNMNSCSDSAAALCSAPAFDECWSIQLAGSAQVRPQVSGQHSSGARRVSSDFAQTQSSAPHCAAEPDAGDDSGCAGHAAGAERRHRVRALLRDRLSGTAVEHSQRSLQIITITTLRRQIRQRLSRVHVHSLSIIIIVIIILIVIIRGSG